VTLEEESMGTKVKAQAPGAARVGVPPSAVEAVLYGVRGSAPSFCAELMLRHEGINYRRVNIVAGRHRRTLRSRGFPAGTVPALLLNGRRVQPNRAIARALDELVPDPTLFPADPAARALVEEAERFIDEVLQDAVRRMIIWSTFRHPDSVTPHRANGRVPVPRSRWRRMWVKPLAFRLYGITTAVIRNDLATLPAMLDKIDGYVADGVLNAPQLTAADLELAPVIAALMGVGDNGRKIDGRPMAALVSRVMPDR
jgi:glutathione S-transferase